MQDLGAWARGESSWGGGSGPAPGGKAAVPCPCVSPCPQGGFQPAPGGPFCVGREADNDKLPGLL